MSRRALDPEQIRERMPAVEGWSLDADGALSRTFHFVDFVAAMGFMSQAALHAERLNHHPQWSNVYGRVEVTLITHDAGGLTGLDFELAAIFSRLAGALPQKAS